MKPPTLREAADEILLREADRDAERIVSIVRMAIAAALLVTLLAITGGSETPRGAAASVLLAAKISLVLLFCAGLVAWTAVRTGRWRPWIAFATVTGDSLLIAANLYLGLRDLRLPGDFAGAMPIVGAIALILTTSSLRLRPGLQLYTSALLTGLLVAVALAIGLAGDAERTEGADRGAILFGPEPNGIRLVMLLLAGAVLVVGAARGRSLLRRAVEETRRRANLSRFLPKEFAPLLGAGRLDELLRGRKAEVALLFVDVRDSTALAETLDPSVLAHVIGAFRARVSAAATTHRGVVDKFVGDGAFLVFGLPEAAPDDAARALACGRDILEAMAEWRREGGPSGSLRVGVGVHWGECFAGVVGDEARLEFTVLGDAVNVASRIEQSTKTHAEPLLASAEVLRAAGAKETGWRLVSAEPPRGRGAAVELYAPVR